MNVVTGGAGDISVNGALAVFLEQGEFWLSVSPCMFIEYAGFTLEGRAGIRYRLVHGVAGFSDGFLRSCLAPGMAPFAQCLITVFSGADPPGPQQAAKGVVYQMAGSAYAGLLRRLAVEVFFPRSGDCHVVVGAND